MKNGENKRLHIQMIENIINRMSSNSFLIKGWSLTILGGLITVYLANINKPMSYLILLLCLFFCLIFWISDTFYLREERCFRSLYEIVRKKDEENVDFSMNPIKSKETFLRCMFRPIFLMSYLPIFIIIIIAIIIKFIH
ncbi:hypothetical protein [Lactobacillus helveticus]|uniref:hypothetical protein n=1 Tax=Lactobacillus helveticus TaxID=1587 RepID=UPI001565AE06|nr:hypothetical protein [Lactobacillus helveticus]NRO67110.1 hypothetical protein [Lactobacillus helveticus]